MTEERKREHEIATGPDGINALHLAGASGLRAVEWRLWDGGVLTVEQLRERLGDGTITRIRGIGPVVASRLLGVVADYDQGLRRPAPPKPRGFTMPPPGCPSRGDDGILRLRVLSMRAYNALYRAGLLTVPQVECAMGEDHLRSTKGVGAKSAAEIEAAVLAWRSEARLSTSEGAR